MAAQTSGEQLREHVKVAAERAVLAGVILTGRSSARRAADRSDVEGGHALDLRRGTGWTDEPDEFEDDRGGAAVDEHEDEHDSDGDGDGDDNRHGHGDGDDAETDPFKELRALAETAGATVVGVLLQRRQRPKSATYLGSGKVEELAAMVKMLGASIVIFDNDLSPAQIRTLERTVEVKIIDRSELILDIFANRAATHMAKLQVEIAQLEYTYPRLRAMWDHLGGIVGGAPVGIGTRGPGEQQLEIDRRLVQRRLQHLERQLSTSRSGSWATRTPARARCSTG